VVVELTQVIREMRREVDEEQVRREHVAADALRVWRGENLGSDQWHRALDGDSSGDDLSEKLRARNMTTGELGRSVALIRAPAEDGAEVMLEISSEVQHERASRVGQPSWQDPESLVARIRFH
jgi:hypothetical protein